jgi:hypothetical protein
MVKQITLRNRDWATHAWGALSVALALIFGILSLVVAEHYKRTTWWVWLGVAGAAIFFVVALYFFVVPLLGKRSRSTGKPVATQAPATQEGIKPDHEMGDAPVSEAEAARERIGYRVSGRGKARPVRAHIRNQDVAFDVRDDGEVDDIDSTIG